MTMTDLRAKARTILDKALDNPPEHLGERGGAVEVALRILHLPYQPEEQTIFEAKRAA